MKKTTKFGLTLLALTVLTACGGGGSGGGDNKATKPSATEITKPSTTTPSKPATSTQATKPATSTPSQPETKPTTPSQPETKPATPSQPDIKPTTPEKPTVKPSLDLVPEALKAEVREAKKINLVDIDGNKIRDFYLSDRPAGIINEKLESGQLVRGINQAYSGAIGIYDNKLFYFSKTAASSGEFYGLYTKEENLPKGSVTYEGQSISASSDYAGKLSLTANFDEKTVEGKITERKGALARDLELEKTTIRQRKDADGKEMSLFTGRATNFFDNDYYIGTFAGPNAEEVIGQVVKGSYKEDGELDKLEAYESFGGTRTTK